MGTGDYIVHMQKKISNHQDEIKELKTQNTQLETQIRALEKAKASGGFVGGDLLEVESLFTQDNLELDTIDSQEIVYDDSSDNGDCQGLAVLPGVIEGQSLLLSEPLRKKMKFRAMS